jgi:hypothetical protein
MENISIFLSRSHFPQDDEEVFLGGRGRGEGEGEGRGEGEEGWPGANYLRDSFHLTRC